MTKPSRGNRGPVAIIARVPLTEEEHKELCEASEYERTTKAELMRRAIREYIDRPKGTER